jgi:hypothetical protein
MRVPPTLDILGISKRLISERLSENKFRITFSSKYSQNNNKYNKYPSVFFTPCKRWKITMIKKCFLSCVINGEFYEDIPVKIRNYVPSVQIQDLKLLSNLCS